MTDGDDLLTETGCTIRLRAAPVSDFDKVSMVLDMGRADGRITPEVLLTPHEARTLAAALLVEADR